MIDKFYLKLFQAVLEQGKGCEKGSSKYRVIKRTLNWIIKEYQGTYKLYASQKAVELAKSMELNTLDKYSYKNQKKPIEKGGMGDVRNKEGTFYREHVYPISQIIDELMKIDSQNIADINKILSKISIAWITRKQQPELDKNKEGRYERGDDPIAFCEKRLKDKFVFLKNETKDSVFFTEAKKQ